MLLSLLTQPPRQFFQRSWMFRWSFAIIFFSLWCLQFRFGCENQMSTLFKNTYLQISCYWCACVHCNHYGWLLYLWIKKIYEKQIISTHPLIKLINIHSELSLFSYSTLACTNDGSLVRRAPVVYLTSSTRKTCRFISLMLFYQKNKVDILEDVFHKFKKRNIPTYFDITKKNCNTTTSDPSRCKWLQHDHTTLPLETLRRYNEISP